MGVVDEVTETVAPVIGDLGALLVDVEHRGGVLRVVVDQDGGIGVERLAEVTRAVSQALDEADPLPGHYTLEVSSPGLERPLRRPEQFARAVGEKVAVKTRPSFAGERRLTGVLLEVSPQDVRIAVDGLGPVTLPLAEIDRARTVFDWGPAPKPGKGSRPGAAKGTASRETAPKGTVPKGTAAELPAVGEQNGIERPRPNEG